MLVAAACSNSSASAPSTTEAPATTEATTTTTEAPTTTLPPTTTTIPVPVYPLTGMPVTDEAILARPALIAKIDNAPAAIPQTGFNSADLVFEEIVNDNITRFAMVFHSQDSDPVGPFRSGRLQDIELLGCLNKPLFGWSGGNAIVTGEINNSDFVNMGPSKVPAYFRDSTRNAPHNLYSSTQKLWELALDGWGLPPKLFEYRDAQTSVQGTPAAGVDVKLDSYKVKWTWNATSGLYERQQNGKVHKDAGTNSVIVAPNVVVMVMDYTRDSYGTPFANSVGTGEVWVFTGGNVVKGTWTRADRLDTFHLTDEQGNPILLTPGRTFIEMPRPDNTQAF